MTASEKILSGIISEAEAEAEKKNAEAEKQCEALLAEAQKKAEALRAQIAADAEKKAAVIAAAGESAAALVLRDATLAIKRELIGGVLRLSLERLNALPDGEYFSFLAALLAGCGAKQGELCLCARDLGRDTSALTDALRGTQITLCDQPADIPNGFLLRDGDIEINASFEALLREKQGVLVDAVNGILFQNG